MCAVPKARAVGGGGLVVMTQKSSGCRRVSQTLCGSFSETMTDEGLCKVCATSAHTEACPVLQATSVWNILHNKLALIALPLLLSILPTTLTFKLARPNPRG